MVTAPLTSIRIATATDVVVAISNTSTSKYDDVMQCNKQTKNMRLAKRK